MKSFFNKYSLQIGSLLLVAIMIYGKTINYEFVIDDKTVITNNKFVHNNDVKNIITTTYWEGYADEVGAVYRPIPLISYVLTNLTLGNTAKSHHFINVLLWGITLVVLLFFLTQSLLPEINKWLITTGIILWAVLPTNIETIANIKGRDDMLALLFSLSAMIYLMKVIEENKIIKNSIIAGVLFVLAMFSKETAIIFYPFIIVLFYIKSDLKKNWKSLLIITGFYAAALLIRGVITSGYVAVHLPENNMVMMFNGIEKLYFKLHLFLMYFVKLVLPVNLSWDYSYGYFELKNYLFEALLSILLITFLLYSFYRSIKNKSITALFILMYMSGILLVSNILFLSGSTFAERFLFIPSLGLVLWLIYYINENNKLIKYKNYILFSLIVVYGLTTFARVGDWKTEEILITEDFNKSKKSFRTELAYLEIQINKYKTNPNNLQLREQIQSLIKTSQDKYSFVESVWNLSGDFYKTIGNLSQAEKSYKKAIGINSTSFIAYVNLGYIYQETKNFPSAKEYYQKAIEINPNNHIPYSNLGMMLHGQNKYLEAKEYYLKALTINPDNPTIKQNLQNVNNAIQLYNLK